MTNAQTALNKEYSDKSQVERIYLSDLNFNQPSELILNNYPNLKKITNIHHDDVTIYSVPNLIQLTIINCLQLEEIDIHSLENNQQLILNNLPNLKKFYCRNNNLTNLEINNCANLETIYCSDNQFTQIKLPQREKLEWLGLRNNKLQQDLSFLKDLVNLRDLYLNNNPLYGSLEYLRNMSKLETLWIGDTDLDSGLEYLPESVEDFSCSVKERKDAKCQTIYDLFADDQGIVETKWDGNIKNFPQKIAAIKQEKKQWRNLNFTEQEIKSWMEADLNFHEYNFANYLKNEKNLAPLEAKENLT